MIINFKWSVNNVIKMPLFGEGLVETKVLERRFREDKNGTVIEYKTDLLTEGVIFTEEEIKEFN